MGLVRFLEMRPWEFLKAVLFRLGNLIFRKHKRPEHVATELEKKLGAKIAKRRAWEGRPVNTRQPGPNMPKSQPCPVGHGWKRRKEKTMGGANYHCWCGDFFVRAIEGQ